MIGKKLNYLKKKIGMTNNKTIIGIYNGFVVSVEELVNELNTFKSVYTIQQLTDFRYATCLIRFNYNPYTGEKIDWKTVKRILEVNVNNR